MPHLVRSYRGGDDKLISGVAAIAESGGLRVVGVKEVAPEVFVSEGVLGHYQPSENDKTDIARALAVIAALGPFDVGQAAIVANNHVLAVEASEGTDNMLVRIAELRRLGRVTAPPGVGVLVKAPKPGQDRRFDLPSIGPRTIENVARAGLAGLAVTAGGTMIAEPDQVTAAADRAKIFLLGVREDGDDERARPRTAAAAIDLSSLPPRNPAMRWAPPWRKRLRSAKAGRLRFPGSAGAPWRPPALSARFRSMSSRSSV